MKIKNHPCFILNSRPNIKAYFPVINIGMFNMFNLPCQTSSKSNAIRSALPFNDDGCIYFCKITGEMTFDGVNSFFETDVGLFKINIEVTSIENIQAASIFRSFFVQAEVSLMIFLLIIFILICLFNLS
jgi:hypothetical protein